MKILSIAMRNIVRYWRRTLVTTLAMAFAGFIMILFAALMAGMIQTSERNAVIMDSADVQVHAHGYLDDPDLYKRVDNADALVDVLQRAGFFATQRLYGFGLAAAGSSSAGVRLRGIHLGNEATVTQIHHHVLEGAWLDEGVPHGVVVGKKLARTLGVSPGDEVVIVSQATDGSMANDLYFIRGVLKSVAEDVDRGGFYLLEHTFRQLMVLPEGAHEVAVMRPDRATDLESATAEVAALAPDYETKNWRQLQPVIARILDMADAQIIIMIVITYIAVGTVILNAMLMSVFERIHEFGVMKAIGVTPWQLTVLIYAEMLVQVIIAAVIALLTGWWVADYFQTNGIDLSAIAKGASFGGVAMDPIWRAYVTTEALVTPIVFLFIVAVVAVIYPAIKAALIQPVKAIYFR